MSGAGPGGTGGGPSIGAGGLDDLAGSCAATPRHAVVAWTTGRRPRSGTPSGPPAARSQQNW